MSSKVLLDTNILIYSIDEESKYFERSQNIILNNNLELYTTSKNLSEFLAVITRIPKNLMTIDEALVIIQDFVSISTILYPSDKSFSIFKDLLHKYKPVGINTNLLALKFMTLKF